MNFQLVFLTIEHWLRVRQHSPRFILLAFRYECFDCKLA